MKADAVFEGGGVRGIALVGAVSVAEELGYTWENVAGTSAGAIVASLIASGYEATELKEIMAAMDYTRFLDRRRSTRIPLVGNLINLVFKKGIYRGDAFREWLVETLAAKGKRFFGDIRTEYPEEEYRYKLRVIASDLTRGRMLVLPQDVANYGLDPDELGIADAVRMSMSIPYFFEPARLGQSLIVDGGLLSNFPVWLFDSDGIPEWPIFGFNLVSEEEKLPRHRRIVGPITLLKALFLTMMQAHDAHHVSKANRIRTIYIDTLDIGAVEFDLSKERTTALYESGRRAAQEFFESWNFRAYVDQHRSPK